MTTTATAAIIPTRESSLYPTFGVDLIIPADLDADRDTEWIDWIELHDFPVDVFAAARDALLERGIHLGELIEQADDEDAYEVWSINV